MYVCVNDFSQEFTVKVRARAGNDGPNCDQSATSTINDVVAPCEISADIKKKKFWIFFFFNDIFIYIYKEN